MKVEIDMDKEDISTLMHIKHILDNRIEKLIGEDPNFPVGLVRPLDILKELENKVGKAIPIDEFEAKLIKDGFEKKEIPEIIDSLKKQGSIFESRQGFLEVI